MKRSIVTAALGFALVTMTATAQDMMRHIDLSSPDMVSAEMTRGEVEAAQHWTRTEQRRRYGSGRGHAARHRHPTGFW